MSCSCGYSCRSKSYAPITLADIKRSDANVGESPVWDGNNWVPGTPTLDAAVRKFDTLDDLLAEDSEGIVFAYCRNFEGSDSTEAVWMKVNGVGLTDNGTDVRQAEDGSIYRRIFTTG